MTYELAPDHEEVGGITVGGPTYIERATAALQALGGKTRALGQEGAPSLRRMARTSPQKLSEQCDAIEQLTEFVLTRLRALVDESR